MDSIRKALALAEIEGEIQPLKMNGKYVPCVWGVSPENKEIPGFAHPLFFKTRDGSELVILDVRGYTRGRKGEELSISNMGEYNFNVVRAALTVYAQRHGVEDMAGLGDLPMTVFARYLGENITKRLAFSPQEQMLITMVAAVYYACMFRPAGEIDERELQKIALKVARATRIPADVVFDHAATLRHMDGPEDFVQVVREVLNNKRAENLNVPLLFAIVGGGWFGLNQKETMAVALEHLPTFLGMVYMSLLDRSYRNSGIAKIVQASDRNNAGKSFLLNTSRLIEALNV
jgi:hypothetical protein